MEFEIEEMVLGKKVSSERTDGLIHKKTYSGLPKYAIFLVRFAVVFFQLYCIGDIVALSVLRKQESS